MVSTIQVNAANMRAHLLFSATMDGAQQVPAVPTTAQGVGGLTLSPGRDTLCVNVSWTGLSSPLIGLHIHQGVAGTNGPVLVDLMPFVTGDRVLATITGASITPALIAMHLRGELYLNLHTNNNPDGEIRGQILIETDHAFVADLNGAQQVPPVMTTAFGLGTFQLARHRGTLSFNAVFDGLSGPITAAHLHLGFPGTSGAIVQDLGAFITGNRISGSVDPTAYLAGLQDGAIYLNVHTSANPDGEIRGQLVMPMGIPFDASLDGEQQVPVVNTDAVGAVSLIATYDMDSLWYDVVVNGLSGPITFAHLHSAPAGSNGSVAMDIAAGINGNRVRGWFTGLTAVNARKLLQGTLYVNLHTDANVTGEVRGQVYRYIREGYTIALDGGQEVPPVSTTGVGAGIVSVDRAETNAHVMFVVTPDMVQAAHFHEGVAGTSGPVVFDMTDLILLNNAVSTYWKSTDAVPFTTLNADQLLSNSLYLNVHTIDLPDGEVRGQVWRGAVCSEIENGMVELAPSYEQLNVWPVPVHDVLMLSVPNNMAKGSLFEAFDARGALVLSERIVGNAMVLPVNVEQLPAGLFVGRITARDRILTARFTKE